MTAFKPASAYAPGHVKVHPDWPANVSIAQRTGFDDDDDTPCNSWKVIHPTNGSIDRRHDRVADWPDVDELTLTPVIEVEGPTQAPAITS